MYSELKLTATTLNVIEGAKAEIESSTATDTSAPIALKNTFFLAQAEKAGVTTEELKKVEQFREDFVAGVTMVAGEKAINKFADDTKMQSATLTADMGKDTAKVVTTRHKSGTVQAGPAKGKEWAKYGSTHVTIRNEASAKTSQLARVFGHISTSAEGRLK